MKKRIIKEPCIQLYEMARDSVYKKYEGNYDILVYAAAASKASAGKLIQDNVITAITMMEFCRKHHIKRIIYLSSDSIYGELHTDIATEAAVMVNPGFYGMTKYLAERIIMDSGIPYYIIRMPGIVGGIQRDVFLCRLIAKMKEDEGIVLYNMDKVFNNVLHIDDLSKFIMLLCLLENNGNHEVFLLGNTEYVKLREIAYYLKKLTHSRSKIENIDTQDKRYFTLDVSKAVEYGYSSRKMKDILQELCHHRGLI
ncbi:MAG: NAD(P)-dependent oxidoreductase [Lachnospiraceae bacterium]|nr:NAD(P)-dependent oxidoreductase [Lachnospiraceae bacterium]